jgi:hypothetical protein
MNLTLGNPSAWNQRFVRVVQHKLGESLPSGGVIHQVVIFRVLHDADAAQFTAATGGSEIFAAQQQVAFSTRIPNDLIAEVGRSTRYRSALVVEVPIDPIGRISQPRPAILAADIRK